MTEISREFKDWLECDLHARAFVKAREDKPIPIPLLFHLGLHALFTEPFLYIVRNYPGAVGIKLREVYYKNKFRDMGKNVILDEGVRIDGPKNISISDFVWIDKNVRLFAPFGSIYIGRRVHIAENAVISGGGHIVIEDYVGIARNVSIYSHSEAIDRGKRMSGPMVPEFQKGMKTAAIKICKDAFVGVNSVILPGVTIGRGAIIGPNAVVTKNVGEWEIVFGAPAKVVARRPKVTVEDI